ncbi:histone-like nucleoid-structuring protein Lsr2 [Jongsikchunia kroppenstedtii]|uniref:histone-like nucleoid-structuring protein Lsr2 n=1 Tax=Jongsikchunia kroppenstedtii TaxID=1121721 RepID=UPI00036180BB|nr:Lsr2 family protein [Jongsikchunia kroppenstedtii]
MAKKIIVEFVDDVDPAELADETVEFTIDGVNYTIDLSSAHAMQLRFDFQKWIEHASYLTGRRKSRGFGLRSDRANAEHGRQIRAWAQSQGIDIAARGRIPDAVINQYIREHARAY